MAKATAAPKGPVTEQDLKLNVDTDGATYEKLERDSSKKLATNNAIAKAQALALSQKKLAKGKKAKLTDKEEKEAAAAARKEVAAETPEQQAADIKAWKTDFIGRVAGMKGDSFQKAAAQLRGETKGSTAWVDQTPGQGADEFKKVFDGKNYDNFRRPLLDAVGKSRLYDPDWQPETSASFINKDGEKTYPDPEKDPYFVSNYHKNKDTGKMEGYPPGTWAKITAPNGNSVWARALDTNESLGVSPEGAVGKHQLEASPALFRKLGYDASGTDGVSLNGQSLPNDTTFHVQVYPGSEGGVAHDKLGYLTPDENAEAGKLLESKEMKSISGPEDLERARKVKKGGMDTPQVPPTAKKTGLLLENGWETVVHGRKQLAVGYGGPDCLHSGGGYVNQGSCTVYVYKYPLSRIGDGTSDDLNVVSGAEDTWIGGAPTGTALA